MQKAPLALYAGRIAQLQAGDTIGGVASPLIYASATAVTVSNTVTKTAVATIPIPANTLGTAGAPLSIELDATYLNNSGVTMTLAIEISYGGTVLWSDTSAALTAAAGTHELIMRLDLINVSGSASAQQLTGLLWMGTAAGATTGNGDFATVGSNVLGPAVCLGGVSAVNSALAQNLVISVTRSVAATTTTFTLTSVRAYTIGQGPTGATGPAGPSGAGTTTVPTNPQTGTAYTLAIGDVGYEVECTNASPITVTVPPGVFTAGQIVFVSQGGGGQVTLAAGAGVTLLTPATLTTRSAQSTISIRCTASNTFRVGGDIT